MALAMSSAAKSLTAPPVISESLELRQSRASTAGFSKQLSADLFTGLSRHNSTDLGATNRRKVASIFMLNKKLNATRRCLVTKAMSGGAGGAIPTLNELPLVSYINSQGRILPPVEPGTKASVFAVLDKNKKVQYIGFSKDVRNSLRTLMGRRPEFCYYYKLVSLSTIDQKAMLDTRQQWMSELGIPPVGNTDPVQRDFWEKPADAGSISERGKAAAALSKAKTLLQMMKDRGLTEEMVYDPALLEKGKCDVLLSEGLSDQEMQDMASEEAASAAKSHHVAVTAPSGELVEFEIEFQRTIKTNGGWMYDLIISKDDKDTRHRVICGKIYSDAAGVPAEEFVERVFAFLLFKKIPRHTEGVLSSEQFPVNYFAVSEVAQNFPELKDWFSQDLPDSYWRFNRIHTYGAQESPILAERPQITAPQY